jgi:hypothetical protein
MLFRLGAKPLILVCAALVVAALVVAVARGVFSRGNPVPAEAGPARIDGVWVAKVDRAAGVVPCDEGESAWVWEEDAVRQVGVKDPTAAVKGKDWKLPGKRIADELYPAHQPDDSSSAWVITRDARELFVVAANAEPLQPQNDALRGAAVDTVWGRGGEKRLWISVKDNRKTVYRVDTLGNTAALTAPGWQNVLTCWPGHLGAWAHVQTGANAFAIYQLPDDGQPVLGVDGLTVGDAPFKPETERVAFPTALLVTAGGGKQLYRLGVTGDKEPVAWKGEPRVGSVSFDSRGKGAWITADDRQRVYRLKDDGTVLNDGNPALTVARGETIDRLYPDHTAGRAWVKLQGDSGKVYLVAEQAPFFWPVSFEQALVQSVVTGAADGGAWVVLKDKKGIYYVQADEGGQAPQKKLLAGTDSLKVAADEDPTPAGNVLWARGQDKAIYRIARESGYGGPPYLPDERVDSLRAPTRDGNRVWALPSASLTNMLIDADRPAWFTPASFRRGGLRQQMYPAKAEGRGWISTTDGVYVYGPASDLRDRGVTVKINGQTLDLSDAPKSAPPPEIRGTFSDLEVDNSALRTFFDSWRGRDPGSEERLPQTFKLMARSGKEVPPNGQQLATKQWDPAKDALHMTPAPEEPVSLAPDDPYALDLTFVDLELGSKVAMTWPDVRFKRVFYQDPAVLAVLCYAAGLALTLLVFVLKPYRLPAGAWWGPILGWVIPISGGLTLSFLTPYKIDLWLLGALIALTLLLVLVCALFYPPLLAVLAKNCRPIDLFVARFVASRPWFRKRQFACHLASLDWELTTQGENSFNERYVSLPVAIPRGGDLVLDHPAEAILALLAGKRGEERRSVLIMAPGGRGKSALLREVVRLAFKRFALDGSAPLPVFVNDLSPGQPDGGIEAALTAALQKYLVSEQTFADGLMAGDFLAVFDGVTEVGPTAKQLAAFSDKWGGRTPLLLTARSPQDYARSELAEVVTKERRGVVVEPMPLDDKTLPDFERTYLERDRDDKKATPAPLSAEMKRVCRVGKDGTSYLPLLVRLAIRVGATEGGIGEIFEKTLHQLIGPDRDDPLIGWVEGLCVDTYWKGEGNPNEESNRLIPFGRVPPESRPKLRRLLEVGLLQPYGSSTVGNDPAYVRFFHDTMQSYLTACGLRDGKADSGPAADLWEYLRRAAGARKFGGPSEIADEGGSELFQMCLHVFAPPATPDRVPTICRVLESHLESWADNPDYDRKLTKDAILLACPREPENIQEEMRALLDINASPSALIRRAVHACERPDPDRELHNLTTLYVNLARRIWDLDHPPDRRPVVSPPQPLAGAAAAVPTGATVTT